MKRAQFRLSRKNVDHSYEFLSMYIAKPDLFITGLDNTYKQIDIINQDQFYKDIATVGLDCLFFALRNIVSLPILLPIIS
jgi:hypothetical protein